MHMETLVGKGTIRPAGMTVIIMIMTITKAGRLLPGRL